MTKPALPIAGPWPRLTDELPLHDPRECHQCGSGDELEVWQEHDLADLAEPFYLVLCTRCSLAIIPDHPRLYRRLERNEPAPGAMPICLNCAHRAGSLCWHRDSRARGGRGLALEYPSPTRGFMDYRAKDGKRGHAFTIYPGVVYACAGKELAFAS